MKTILLVLCSIGVVLSAPADQEAVSIRKYDNDNNGLGTYKYAFETSDLTAVEEEGTLKNAEDPEKAYLAVRGSYSYVGPDGVTYLVTYIADENGFQPQGEHLPVSPQSLVNDVLPKNVIPPLIG